MTPISVDPVEVAGRTARERIAVALGRFVRDFSRIPETVWVSLGNWEDLNRFGSMGHNQVGLAREGVNAVLTVIAYGREVRVIAREDLGDLDFIVDPPGLS